MNTLDSLLINLPLYNNLPQMNTRGLVELIVLNVGLEAKVISPKLFTIMVLMVRHIGNKDSRSV